MSDYLHHVPGRLRVRSRALKCESAGRSAALRQLRALPGVHSVRLNSKAGSVTVCYETDTTDPDLILELLRRHECVKRPPVARNKPAGEGQGRGITAEIGKMALGALVSKGVSFSLTSLLGARI